MQDISMLWITPAYNKINIRIVTSYRSDRMKIEKSEKNAENRRQNKIIQRKRLNNMNRNQWKGIKGDRMC
jgi:hypothetical protein